MKNSLELEFAEVEWHNLVAEHPFFGNDLQMGRGEPIEDTSKVLSSMVDGIVLRTMEHETQIKFAENSSIPIINGRSDRSHPG